MITIVVFVALANLAAPEIVIDQNGFVSVIESKEEYEREQKNLELLAEAARAYRDYHKKEGVTLDQVIAKHEQILDSGMELAPELRLRITKLLAELHHERAMASTGISQEQLRDIDERMRTGLFDQKDMDAITALMHADEYQRNKQTALDYREQSVQQLSGNDCLEAARQLQEMAVMAQSPVNKENVIQAAHYYARSRQQALEAAQEEGTMYNEAVSLAQVCAHQLLTLLEQLNDAAVYREFETIYANDKELGLIIESLIVRIK